MTKYPSSRRSNLVAILGCGSVVVLLAAPLAGADVTWKLPAGQSGDWSVPANWIGGEPTAASTAYIVDGGMATVDTTATCDALSLGSSAGSGIVRMTGGSLSVASYEFVGDSGTGVFTQSGGTNSANNLEIGVSAGSHGTYNLNGGLLLLSSASQGLGTAAFNFNGGTLQAGGAFSTSLPMALGAGGAHINTAGFNVALSNALSGPGGLNKIGSGRLTLSGGNTYSGQTFLTSGTLAINAPPPSGLYEGLVNNANEQDTTDPIPHTSIQAVARWGASTTADNNGDANVNVFPNWGPNATWGYSGYLDNTSTRSVTYTFGKNFDDNAFLVIGGVSVISNVTWNQNVTVSITLTPGFHSVDLRFGQGLGNVGPNTGAYKNYGISYNTVGNTATTGTWLQMGAGDPNTQFFATDIPGLLTSQVVMSSNTTLDLSGSSAWGNVVGLASLADAPGSPTGHEVFLGGNTLETGIDNSSTTFSGTIAGSGGLIKQGSGTFTLAGTNTYRGITTVSAGILLATTTASLPAYNTSGNAKVDGGAVLAVRTGDGTTGWSSGQIDSLRASVAWTSNTAGLGIDTSNGDFAYGSSITQPLSLTKLGSNTLTLTGANSYTGGTTINGGVLKIDGNTALGATIAPLIFTGNGTLQAGAGPIALSTGRIMTINSGITATIDTQSFNMSMAAPIHGQGNLSKIGAGELALTGFNTYSGSTSIGGGTLQIGDGYSGESLNSPSISNNGTLVFDHSDALLYSGVISGTGSLVKDGSGTLTLAAENTFSGGTTIRSGTLKLVGEISGFGGRGLGWAVNSIGISSVPITNDVLTLTNNNSGEARSAFSKTPVSVGPFTASFTYQAGGNLVADGAAFVLQNDSRGTSALGSDGGGLGYSGITPSAAIEFNLWAPNGQGTAFHTNGATGGYTSTGLGLSDGHPIRVVLTYDGSSDLTEKLTDLDTLANWTKTYGGVDLAQIIGGNSLHVGFTGGDGLYYSTQTISNFVFVSGGVAGINILPASGPVRIGSGATLDMSGVNQTIASLADDLPGATVGESVLMTGGSLTVGDGTSTTFSGSIRGIGGVLTKIGSGELVLSGSNTYTGGTLVAAGTLVATNSSALPNGTSLTVGAGAGFVFDPSPAPASPASVAVAVPEPGTLPLFAAGAIGLLGWMRRRRR